MNPRVRLLLFLLGAAGFGAFLLWGLHGLPDFGDYQGPYGYVLNATAPAERQITNVVTAVNYDYRGLDTLGEEFILFASVAGVTLILREERDEVQEEAPDEAPGREVPPQSEAVGAAGLCLFGVTILFAIYVIAHGHLTPGGGFQGGSILASAWTLAYLAGSYRIFHRATPQTLVDSIEAIGAGAYVLIGLATLATGAAFLQNVLPLGSLGTLLSAGTIPVINAGVGVEVTAAVIVVLGEFLRQALEIRQRAAQQRENEGST